MTFERLADDGEPIVAEFRPNARDLAAAEVGKPVTRRKRAP